MAELPSGTVTFLLTDIEGSTRLLQQLGDRYAAVLEEHRGLVRGVFEARGGREVDASGDAFLVAFPRALDALEAAAAIQKTLAERAPSEAGPLRVRIGLHTGQPMLTASGYFGLDVHRAARLCAAGYGGQVLLSQSTRDLVEYELPPRIGLRDLGLHRLKDLQRPEHVFQAVIADLPADFPALHSLETRPNNLPAQLTNFIGREQELGALRVLLGRTRLLTLTGPGGSGKTRLALQVAAEEIDRFEDGVFFVGLAPIFDPDLVIPTMAQVLSVPDIPGRPPLECLKDHLRDRQVLLLLDNFEQVLGAAPRLTELLAACPRLTLLVTSRTALRVSGEQEFGVPPMELPDLAQSSLWTDPVAAVGRCEAIQLFVERASAVKVDFRLDGENAEAVATICRRLDGLPLAIELAAARIRLLPPRAMLARLVGRAGMAPEAGAAGQGVSGQGAAPVAQASPLQFLTGGVRDLPARQRTLRDTIAWSYDLLEPSERALFRRLAVFVGGCRLEAADAAAGAAEAGDRRWAPAPDEVYDGVESLLAKNLLRRIDAGGDEPRFTMLETIREYGLEQLAQTGELKALRRWHAGYYLALAEQAEPLLHGAEQLAWLDRLEAEHDNFRAALEWSLAEERGGTIALRLSGALAWFWEPRSYISEGRHWLARALGQASDRSAARMKALYGAGFLAHWQRDSATARALLEESLAIARELGDRWTVGWVLYLLGRVAYFGGDAATARALGEQCHAVAREVGDRWLIAFGPHLLGLAAHIEADYPTARRHYEESLALRREIGFEQGIGILNCLLGMVAFREGDYAGALTYYRESLLSFHALGARNTMTSVLAGLSSLAAAQRGWERAARLAGATATVSENVHVLPIPLAESVLAEAIDRARGALGEAGYQAAWAEGRGLSLDEAIDEGLAVEVRPAPESASMPGASGPPDGLSPRELAVLRLIAAGRTSKEIAEELVVSVPTVERHITHLYTKIDVRSRAEATAYAVKHDLA
jgi:predicted ATPase/class 3 adenylate cyclase/DNA-binding CsgD family transcriptional regulator